MEAITVKIEFDKLKEALEKGLENILKSDYSNPVRSVLEESIKEQRGPIKLFVDGIISDVINDPEFKKKMSDMVFQKMIESALKK